MRDLDMPNFKLLFRIPGWNTKQKVFQRDTFSFLVLMYAGKPWKIISVT